MDKMIAGNYFFIFSLLAIIIYMVVLTRWALVWKLFPESNKHLEENAFEQVTVVVAARNESENIRNCLNALLIQDYPKDSLEIIISDDFSEDNTSEIVKDFIVKNTIRNHVIRLIEANVGELPGKKAALERAIKVAKGNLIITTDADCIMCKHWVRSFNSCYQGSKADMISGLVILKSGNSYFEKLQALEFLSLTGTGAVSLMLKKPLMCNGANLAFTKKSFNNCGGYNYGGKLPTGDDTFLMLQIAKSNKNKVVFNKSRDGIVTSLPVKNIHQLVSQRKRWASKMTLYDERYIAITGAFLLLVNLILLSAIVMFIVQSWSIGMVLLLWSSKALADFLLLIQVSRFAGQQHLLLLFLPATVIFPLYMLMGMLVAPDIRTYSWKGRSYV